MKEVNKENQSQVKELNLLKYIFRIQIWKRTIIISINARM